MCLKDNHYFFLRLFQLYIFFHGNNVKLLPIQSKVYLQIASGNPLEIPGINTQQLQLASRCVPLVNKYGNSDNDSLIYYNIVIKCIIYSIAKSCPTSLEILYSPFKIIIQPIAKCSQQPGSIMFGILT